MLLREYPSTQERRWQLALQVKAFEELLIAHKDPTSWQLCLYPITRALLPIDVLVWGETLEKGYEAVQIHSMEYMYLFYLNTN